MVVVVTVTLSAGVVVVVAMMTKAKTVPDGPGFAGLPDNLRIDGPTKARITITRIARFR